MQRKYQQNMKEGWWGALKTQLITWEVIFSTMFFCGLLFCLNSTADSSLSIQVEFVLPVANMNDN